MPVQDRAVILKTQSSGEQRAQINPGTRASSIATINIPVSHNEARRLTQKSSVKGGMRAEVIVSTTRALGI